MSQVHLNLLQMLAIRNRMIAVSTTLKTSQALDGLVQEVNPRDDSDKRRELSTRVFCRGATIIVGQVRTVVARA